MTGQNISLDATVTGQALTSAGQFHPMAPR
jgi:hypothetical protein